MQTVLWIIAALLAVAALFARRGAVAALLTIAALFLGSLAASAGCDVDALGIEVCRG